ncbi:MAG: YkgJ family cysteine cluster protein [Alphaproteobacteria bacterium]|nr:YkgJ family cysteine cluster protein [Alphaproteobacteria bacterium]
MVAHLRLRTRVAVADALRAGGGAAARARAAHRAACDAFGTAWEAARADVERQGPIACAAGCSACCHQHVAVSAIEAVAVADAITGTQLEARVRAADAAMGTLDAPARRRARIPCPFLDADGSCAIHLARPLRCRGVHGRDAAICRAQTDDPDAADAERRTRSGEHPAFPLAPVRLADAVLAGLAEAGAERGIADDTLELVRAVALLLEEPGRAEATMAGADDLAAARLDVARRPPVASA